MYRGDVDDTQIFPPKRLRGRASKKTGRMYLAGYRRWSVDRGGRLVAFLCIIYFGCRFS